MSFAARYIRISLKLLFKRTLKFLNDKVELKTFIILASLFVGIISGLAAVLLKTIVHFFQTEPRIFFTKNGIDFLLPFTPLAGIIISVVIIQIFFNGKIRKGLGDLIYTIIRKRSDLPKRKMFSHLITSGITIGLGGSAGLEAPIVITGAAIGSNIAKGLKFNYQTRTLLLASGSAAGISAIFNSPIAGVIFAFEVLLPELTISSFIPLLIASASSAVVSRFLYSGQLFFLVTEGWKINALPYYVALGVLSGFISLYIIKTSLLFENILEKFKKRYLKAFFGGLILCSLIFLLPPIYGEGYSTVISLLSGNIYKIMDGSIFNNLMNKDFAILLFTALIIFTKIIATSLTIGSGGNGGIIAPSLFTGALTGFFLAHSLNFLGIAQLNHPNFIVVGMAGILSGVLHSPLTGIFLIAEITGGYVLVVPLMIVTALSFFISKYFHQHSIYTTSLAAKGIKFRSEKEKSFMQQLNISDLVETDFLTIKPNMTLRELVDKMTHTKRNLFPVLDEMNKLVGIVTLDDIREVMLDQGVQDVILVYEIMNNRYDVIDLNTDINKVIDIFEEKQIWNLAVTENDKYVGFLSKSNIFNRYISGLAKQQKEQI